jgi:hypothetical protein
MSDTSEAFYTFRTQRLLHQTTILDHADLLKVRSKGAFGSLHREAAVVSECRRLAAIFTLGHRIPFLKELTIHSSGTNLTT